MGTRLGSSNQGIIQLLKPFTGLPVDDAQSLLEYIATSKWAAIVTVTPEGNRLAEEHARLAGEAMRSLIGSHKLSATEAYSRLQSAGADNVSYDEVMRTLFVGIRPSGLCNREYLILAAAGAIFWSFDQHFSLFSNPWLSVIRLFHIGYNCGFEESEDDLHVSFLLMAGDREEPYLIV